MRARLSAAFCVAVLSLSACSSAPDAGEPVGSTGAPPLGPLGIDVASEELVRLKAEAGMLDCPPSPEPDPEAPQSPANPLPAMSLPCLGGGRDVRLDRVQGPLVLNLWASYCEPCRKELPILQQVHEQAGDQLTVLGVDYEDAKPFQALKLATESGVTYASVADMDAVTATELQVVALPQTVFVDEFGSVVATHRGEITSFEEAVQLLRTHLAVRLPELSVEVP
jgi:thiol-disulfide isomerase/thioredoxin